MRSTPFFCCLLAVSCGFRLAAQSLLEPVALRGVDLPVQGVPALLLAGDIDGDGDSDLVVDETGPMVILRQQNGSFSREVINLGAGNTPLTLADLDADGHLDMVYSIYSPQQVGVWWGNGSGTFPTPNPSTTWVSSVGGAVAGDLDHDSDLDLVIGDRTLVRNLGGRVIVQAPFMEFPALYASNVTPFLIDVDQDGWVDVVSVSMGGDTRIYWNNLGNFTPSFAPTVPALIMGLQAVAAADFDGDGDRDLVFAGRQQAGVMLRAIGPRSFSVDPVAATERHVIHLLAYDADGDQDVDLHVFGGEHDELRLNDGAGHFTAHSVLGTNDQLTRVVKVDLDADGDEDFLRVSDIWDLADPDLLSISAAYSVRPAEFDYIGGFRLPVRTLNVSISPPVDLDGDGWVDLLLYSSDMASSSSLTQVAHGSAGGVFRYRWTDRFFDIDGFFADLNGDGLLDYVQPPFNANPPVWWPNVGGTLGATPIPLPLTVSGPTCVGTGGDFDGDGDMDLLFPRSVGTSGIWHVRLLQNLGGGTFVDATSTQVSGPPAPGSYGVVAAADLDGDADLDVWLTTGSSMQILRNQNGVLTHDPAALAGVTLTGGTLLPDSFGDIDGDGDLDLNAGGRWLRNQGNGTFVETPLHPYIGNTYSIPFAGDLDDDGDLDLIGHGRAAWNDGNGVFTTASGVLSFPLFSNIQVRQVFDADGDGDADAIIQGSQIRCSLLLNRLRHAEVIGAASPGGNLEIRISTRPGSSPDVPFVWLALATAVVAPIDVPGLGRLQVDPLQATLVGGFAMPAAGGEQSWLEPIPNSPALRGVLVAAQTLELRAGRLRLGNLVTATIGH